MQLTSRSLPATGLVFLALSFAPARAQQLFGVDWDSNRLVRISPIDASSTFVGTTGIPGVAGLEFGPGNVLYALSTSGANLYRIDPTTAAATIIGPLGPTGVFEGGLAFSPAGIAYGVNMDSAASPKLFTIDLQTGAGTIVGLIGTGRHDVNGLAWRSDGVLVGVDRETNAMLVIDPGSGAVSSTIPLAVTVGGVSGMTARGDVAYFNNSGPTGGFPATNELFTIDLYTGALTLVGNLDAATHGTGISALAWDLTPSPTIYCTAKVNSQGCTPAIAVSGFPSAASSDGCAITASQVLNGKLGVLFYSFAPDAKLALGGVLCVHPPLQRTPLQSTGGGPPPDNCSGALALDFNAWIQSGVDPALTTGAIVYAQYFYRDALSTDGSGLTDGASLTIGY